MCLVSGWAWVRYLVLAFGLKFSVIVPKRKHVLVTIEGQREVAVTVPEVKRIRETSWEEMMLGQESLAE